MGKKTLEQKKLADIRKQKGSNLYSFSADTKTNLPLTQKNISLSYNAFSHSIRMDVTKTFSLSILIVVAELVLFFLLHNHVLALPFGRY